jgi:hypothetical protein
MRIAFNTARTAVTISMPGYVHKMLTSFRPQFFDKAHRPAQTPGRYIVTVYGQKTPQLTSVDDSPRLPPESITELQAIIGTLLYYARAVDPSLLPISNELASKQAQPTAAVMNAAWVDVGSPGRKCNRQRNEPWIVVDMRHRRTR